MIKNQRVTLRTLQSTRQNATTRLNMIYRQVSRLQSELAIRDREVKTLQTKMERLQERSDSLEEEKSRLLVRARQLETSNDAEPQSDFSSHLLY